MNNVYVDDREYDVCSQVRVKNLDSKENDVEVILPFPLQTFYQRILGQPKLTPKIGKIKRESKLQNRYVYWKEILKPNQEKVFELDFKVLVTSRTAASKRPDKTYKRFLRSDKYINVNKKIVRISKGLIGEIANTEEKLKVLNDFVVKNLEYGNPIEGLYSSNDALEKEKVDCGGFDTLLAALCIASKIPARVISGFFATSGNNNQMHAWLEIFLPTKGWVVADPSIEKLHMEGRTKKFAKLGFVGSDRIALSLGHNFKIKIGNRFLSLAILQNPVVSAEEKISYDFKFEARAIK